MTIYADRVQFTTATTGTGSITVGSATAGYRLPAIAGVVDTNVVKLLILDGSAWEISSSTASTTATVFTRTLVSSSTGSLLSLSGSAIVSLIASAADLNNISNITQGTLADARLSSNVPLINAANVFSTLQTVAAGNSTTSVDYISLTPTDYGTGKPRFYVKKNSATTSWTLGLHDGTGNTGTLNFDVSSFSWLGNQVTTSVDWASASTASKLVQRDSNADIFGRYLVVNSGGGIHTTGLTGGYVLPSVSGNSSTTVRSDHATGSYTQFQRQDATALGYAGSNGTYVGLLDASFNPLLTATSSALTYYLSNVAKVVFHEGNAASTGAVIAGTSTTTPLTPANIWAAAGTATLTDGATITPDLAGGINFSVTIAGNRTLANPSNPKVGQTGVIAVTQDATGSRTLSYGTNYKFAGGTAPTLTTTASRTDLLFYQIISSTFIYISFIKDVR